MLAHNQCQLHNVAALGRGLDVDGVTIARYLGGVGEPDDYPMGGGIRAMTMPAMVSWIEGL